MTSPYLTAAVARIEAAWTEHKGCPFCGDAPPMCTSYSMGEGARRFLVGCENDDCAVQPQVSGETMKQAWDRWNTRNV